MEKHFFLLNLEVYEQSHIAVVSLPPMHKPKAPAK